MNHHEKMRETTAARPSTLSNLRHGLRRTSKLGGAFLLILLAAPGYAQVRAAADFKASTAVSAPATAGSTSEDKSIRPFRVHIPESALVDLRQRIAAARLPDQETVTNQSQGVQLATMKELVRCWQTDYDWRKAEAKLNALPQFVTTIDGVDIYFIHVRSPHPNAMPLIMTHGWPGSIIELLNVIDPLTNPTAHGGRAEDASMSSSPRCRATGSQASRALPAGIPSASRAPGTP